MDERKEYTCEKALLREQLLKTRAAVHDRLRRTEAAAERILPLLHGNVLIYISIGSELSTLYIADKLLGAKDVRVFAPYTVDGIIYPRKVCRIDRADRYGNMPQNCYFGGANDIKEFDIDICVTPLVGFNADGLRIGYGRGCYDRFFAAHPDIYKIGLAFDCQKAVFKPDSHDVALDSCVTETKVIKF